MIGAEQMWVSATSLMCWRSRGSTSRSGDGASSESESESVAKNKYQNITKNGKRKSKSSTEASKQVQGSAGKKGRDPDLDFLDSIIREQPVLEEEDEEDCLFIIFCFFKDWDCIREYFQERWYKHIGVSFYLVLKQVYSPSAHVIFCSQNVYSHVR